MGIPGSGKTTLSSSLANHYHVSFLHGSTIVRAACPGDWLEQGHMAPEPAASKAILEAIGDTDQWVLDGYPRHMAQWGYLPRGTPIIYLEVAHKEALKRLATRGRFDMSIEAYRIREQARLLSPVKQLAACVIPTTYLSPSQVLDFAIEWLERGTEPW